MKHTPGPWRYRKLFSDRFEIIGGNKILAELLHYQKEHDESNARLIAAAPDMLICLKNILGACEMMIEKTEGEKQLAWKQQTKSIKQVICKAEGAL